MMSAAVAGTTFRPTPSYTTLRDVTGLDGGLWKLATGRLSLATQRWSCPECAERRDVDRERDD